MRLVGLEFNTLILEEKKVIKYKVCANENETLAVFLRAEGEHASQIYRRLKELYGEQCLARCTIYRWCQRYGARRKNIKDLPRPGEATLWPTVARFRLRMSSY
ncbi:hypothetical protein AVEN_53684-1 [Araneus ventricosus]|uniref:Mos1 transposase HTH domain-containing protein n=1 Tax=Araneus ventricosus TaxID=182803 RepID=A0A4Y2VNW6_ARAVE|nr:hypothetical protein AVEN_53684-1 [Araneus ventricosus]